MEDYYAAVDTTIQNSLQHHGILGQKWGIRRWQNKDGSLTPEGKARYLKGDGYLTDEGVKKYLHKEYRYDEQGNKYEHYKNKYPNPRKDLKLQLAIDSTMDKKNFAARGIDIDAPVKDLEKAGVYLNKKNDDNRFSGKIPSHSSIQDVEDIIVMSDNPDVTTNKQYNNMVRGAFNEYLKVNKYKNESSRDIDLEMISAKIDGSIYDDPGLLIYSKSKDKIIGIPRFSEHRALDHNTYDSDTLEPNADKIDHYYGLDPNDTEYFIWGEKIKRETQHSSLSEGSHFAELLDSSIEDSLQHWGILGMHWGVRRYQNRDGTLTEAGKRHYAKIRKKYEKEDKSRKKQREREVAERARYEDMNKFAREASDEELQAAVRRMQIEQNFKDSYNRLHPKKESGAKRFFNKYKDSLIDTSAKAAADMTVSGIKFSIGKKIAKSGKYNDQQLADKVFGYKSQSKAKAPEMNFDLKGMTRENAEIYEDALKRSNNVTIKTDKGTVKGIDFKSMSEKQRGKLLDDILRENGKLPVTPDEPEEPKEAKVGKSAKKAKNKKKKSPSISDYARMSV